MDCKLTAQLTAQLKKPDGSVDTYWHEGNGEDQPTLSIQEQPVLREAHRISMTDHVSFMQG